MDVMLFYERSGQLTITDPNLHFSVLPVKSLFQEVILGLFELGIKNRQGHLTLPVVIFFEPPAWLIDSSRESEIIYFFGAFILFS
jgi:hypothetical protein